MSIGNEIEKQLQEHLVKWDISISTYQLNLIIDDVVNNKCSSFNLIYDGNSKLVFYKKIERSNILFNGNLYSYDGGNRFQWSEKETLLIDISLIRNLKIDKIISKK